MDKRDGTIQSEGHKDNKPGHAVPRRVKLAPHADGDAENAEDNQHRDVSVLSHRSAVEAIVVGWDTGTRDQKSNSRVIQSAED